MRGVFYENVCVNCLIICIVLLYNKFECHKIKGAVFFLFACLHSGKDGSKVTTVVATPGQGPDRPQEVSYTDTKVIGNGSFGVVYQAKLCDTGEMVAIKKVLQDKRFKVRETVSICKFRCFLPP
jgi:hypothetical protein